MNEERYSIPEQEEFRPLVLAQIERVKSTPLGVFPAATEEQSEKHLKHLADALLRIDNGTYGTCRITGKLISKERLRLVPHASIAIDARKSILPA